MSRKFKGVLLAGVSALGLVSAQVMAAVPAEATAAFTAVQTDGESMIGSGWPVLAAIVGGLVLMKLFKKVISRAT